MLLRKLGIGLVVVAGLGWLFWQSVQSSLSEPYIVNGALVADWRLATRGPMTGGAVLVLQPPGQFRAELFQQIFARTMESMTSPAAAAMPLVLSDEYRSLRGTVSLDDLQTIAEAAGLDRVAPTPVCIGHLRRPPADQLYYALFDAPEVGRFRHELSQRFEEASSIASAPFPLVVPLAASDGDFDRWWPLAVTGADCVAPIEVQ